MQNKKYFMKLCLKIIAVLAKLKFRQKIKCQTSLKRRKSEEKLPAWEFGLILKEGDARRKAEQRKAFDFGENGTKKGLTGGAKRGKISPH